MGYLPLSLDTIYDYICDIKNSPYNENLNIMGRPIKTERLKKARPILMASTIALCKLNFKKLYAQSRRLNLTEWDDNQDYADYIHNLWNKMLTNNILKDEAIKLEEILGTGDAIQILSDVVMTHSKISNNG